MIRHLQITISGKVENTGFRLYALWGAKEYHINGEVKLKDGNILIEAEGDDRSLYLFTEWCRLGPGESIVEQLTTIEKKIIDYKDFMIQ